MSTDIRKLIDLIEGAESPSVARRRNPNLNEAFWQWFGASQVVDASGNPLQVYHGTKKEISKFDLRGQIRTGGKAYFFSPDPVFAELYANKGGPDNGRIYPVYLRIINMFDNLDSTHVAELGTATDAILAKEATKPYGQGLSFYPFTRQRVLDGVEHGAWNWIEHPIIIAAMKKAGFDGARIQEGADQNYMVFKNTQIKSVFNSRAWDAKSPNISEHVGVRPN